MPKPTLVRITTIPISLNVLLKGQLRFMNGHFRVVAVSSGPKDELVEASKREGVRIVQINMTRAITPLKDIKAVWQLYILFKREKPLIVHTHTPKAGILGMLAANLAGVPHRLHTVAGLPLLEATGSKRKLLEFVEKFTYACATKVYPNSQGLFDIMLKQGYIKKSAIAPLCTLKRTEDYVEKPFISSKVKLIANGSSNGIDTAHFSPNFLSENQIIALKKQLGIGENDFVFVFVGRLVGDKGINELVAAFTNLFELFISKPKTERVEVASLNTLKLLLVGPLEPELDPLKPETLHQIKTHPHIITTGFQKDVRFFLAIGDALVFPSYREGFPNVVMQAGAMGLPSLVTNINGCNEIIVEGRNGLIIPPKDTDTLQKAMLRLVDESNLLQHLKSQAREMITSRYEQKILWEALLKEYNQLLVNYVK